jgi:hypothetical protein
MNAKQTFISACFASDLQEFYQGLLQVAPAKRALFTTEHGQLVHRQWRPSAICAATGQVLMPENIDVAVGYWYPHLWKPVHHDHKKAYMAAEAYDCQLIDTACNDCKHLDRLAGACKKFGKQVSLEPCQSQPHNAACFVHRLD